MTVRPGEWTPEGIGADNMFTTRASAEQAITQLCALGDEWARAEYRVTEMPAGCSCGEWSGEACAWSGPASATVEIEFMPAHLRSTHEAARNVGVYPHNGAVRCYVSRDCALEMLESDGEWCHVVGPVAQAEVLALLAGRMRERLDAAQGAGEGA
ncbi:MAG: hypothetical protein IT370_09325 [Deltaproteobacteria bacterium]|nr:hypothetical protein [Deltaproteobacteria bacterium]